MGFNLLLKYEIVFSKKLNKFNLKKSLIYQFCYLKSLDIEYKLQIIITLEIPWTEDPFIKYF